MARVKEIVSVRGVSQFVCRRHGYADIEGGAAREMIMVWRATVRPMWRGEIVS